MTSIFFRHSDQFMGDCNAEAFSAKRRVNNDMGKPGRFRVQDQAAYSHDVIVVLNFQGPAVSRFKVKTKERRDILPSTWLKVFNTAQIGRSECPDHQSKRFSLSLSIWFGL